MTKTEIITKHLDKIKHIYTYEYKGFEFEKWIENISEEDLNSILRYHENND